ncbi:MAG: hypothetical protein AB2598_16165 [Candidatus Thiodiazotropha sp.]
MCTSECRIHCEMCQLLTDENDSRGFTIQVPVDVVSRNQHLLATIRCRIDAHSHQLTLQRITNAQGEDVALSASETDRLSSVLKKVEDRRLCGNAKICPQRIAQLVSDLQNRVKV